MEHRNTKVQRETLADRRSRVFLLRAERVMKEDQERRITKATIKFLQWFVEIERPSFNLETVNC